jgi:hypothetical protein
MHPENGQLTEAMSKNSQCTSPSLIILREHLSLPKRCSLSLVGNLKGKVKGRLPAGKST